MSLTSEQMLLAKEVAKLLTKGAVTEVPLERRPLCFYSSLFLVPKKDGGMRPVINLRGLNTCIPPTISRWRAFTHEGPGDWMTKVNLKDAYFMIPIQQQDRQFLSSFTGSQDYQFLARQAVPKFLHRKP